MLHDVIRSGPLLSTYINLNRNMISNFMPSEEWDQITYAFFGMVM